jgi:hypothetical protein
MERLRGWPFLPVCFLIVSFLTVSAVSLLSQEKSTQAADQAPSAVQLGQPAPSPAPNSTAPNSTPPNSTPNPIPPNAPPISKQTRFEIIRDFEMQLVYARSAFPMGTKGLILKNGVILPNGEELRQALAVYGPAVKVGDPAHISYVRIKDNHIHFEINGGPVHRRKWYQHIEIAGSNGGGIAPGGGNDAQTNPHGSYVDVYFDKYVPELTAQQMRDLLFPVLDFNARNKEQAYLDTVPPKVKEAILAHQVLVGMNQEMVIHAKGKPPKKVRERDGETEYEEWIYGEPPADVDFVRMVGDEVVRVETMKVGGDKVVRTEREVILEKPEQKEAKQEERPANAPSLRRPGEDSEDAPRPENGPSPTRPMPPPDFPQPSGGPGEIVAVGR